MLCTCSHISKTFTDHVVLHDVSFTLAAGQKLGLVGANGAGKTTLLKILLGELTPDAGSVRKAEHVTIGYLPQTAARADTMTVGAFIDEALGGLRSLEARLHKLEAAMSAGGADLARLLEEYAAAQARFERWGGYNLDYRITQIMAGLGIDSLRRTRVMSSLSGGEATRVGLAALLLREPVLLLLDEPTNHLDFAALAWLETYVRAYRGSALIVSHDRRFLNQTVDAIIELNEHTHTATRYAGDYDRYAATKAQEEVQQAEAYGAQQEEIQRLRRMIRSSARAVAHNRRSKDGDKMAYDHKGGRVDGAISRNVRNAEERLRRIEADPLPPPPKPLSLSPSFDPNRPVSSTPLVASGLRKAYGDHVVIDGIDVALNRQSRVALIGPNGSGKSTLLRILAGVQAPDAGEVQVAGSAVIGYLSQAPQLPRQGTTLTAYSTGRTGDAERIKAELLGYGLFTYPDLLKPVQALSIGQQRKLQLVRLMAMGANLLLLDEPDNHLSLDVVERFEAALRDFQGAVVVVSHDRHFLSRFADEVWQMKDGRMVRRLGQWAG